MRVLTADRELLTGAHQLLKLIAVHMLLTAWHDSLTDAQQLVTGTKRALQFMRTFL